MTDWADDQADGFKDDFEQDPEGAAVRLSRYIRWLNARTRPLVTDEGIRGPLVVIESPLGAITRTEIEDNKVYARKCMRDSIMRGEAPFASHLLYDQPGLLDDLIPEERELGIRAGLLWGQQAERRIVYEDRGVSVGMRRGIAAGEKLGQPIERRKLR